MTTQAQRKYTMHLTRVLIFMIGMVGTVFGLITQNITLILVFTACERLLWLWYAPLCAFELRMLGKFQEWRNRNA